MQRKKSSMQLVLEASVISFFFLPSCENSRILLSLISSYFNYTTVIKQDISSGDQSLHSFRWPVALFRNFLKNADVRFPISLKYVCTALPRDKI